MAIDFGDADECEPGPMNAADARPLIAHMVYRFDIGGLENGVVNLLNRLPRERWRHAPEPGR